MERNDQLLARLRLVRRGADGAFILDYAGVHINGDAAFLGSASIGWQPPGGRFGRHMVWGSP
jgi:hypothetical protein